MNPAQITVLENALDVHDATIDTPEQARRRQTTIDIDALRTIYDTGIADGTLRLVVRLVLLNSGEDV